MKELSELKILVVDDQEMIHQFVRTNLQEEGMTTLKFAYDGVQAKEILDADMAKGQPIELIILDFNMPNMNGLELLRYCRSLPAYDTVPIIMLTADIEHRTVMDCIQGGASAYLVKPLTPAAFNKKVREICAQMTDGKKVWFNRDKSAGRAKGV